MICSASIVPSSPLLIPTIERENYLQSQETSLALEKIAVLTAEANPETIIMISFDEKKLEEMFSLNLSDEYSANFKNFGDLTTEMNFKGDAELIYKIKERFEGNYSSLSVITTTEQNLDINNSVPLYYLKQKIKKFLLVPINCSSIDSQKHLLFGQGLKEEISLSNKRIAVIACHNLSIKEKTDSEIEVLKKNLMDLIKKRGARKFIKQDVYNLGPILTFFGIIQDLKCRPEILSWQKISDFVYLTVNFDLDFKKHKIDKIG